MDKSYLNELLQRYLKGGASREEVQLITRYYDLFQDDPAFAASMTDADKVAVKELIRSSTWENIEREERTRKPGRLLSLRNLVAIAAALLLLVFSARYFFFPATAPVPGTPLKAIAKNEESHVIVLPDGTTVVLDAGSKLNYPSSFDGSDKREVFLTGQAFFDVRHLPSRPFIVHVGGVSVTVLGTAFNIRALPTEPEITVTVKRGKVKVANQGKTLGVIIPRQQITFNKYTSFSAEHTISDENVFRWKEGDLVLDNLTMAEAATVLQERFHVSISVTDSLFHSERFTAIFPRGENLEQALKGICVFNNASYSYNNRGEVVIRLP